MITPEQVQQIASDTTGVLGVTGLIALVTVIWTAIGWVTYSRRGVRDIFGLPPDRRSYVLLKARDLIAAIIFGAALIVGAALTWVGSWLLTARAVGPRNRARSRGAQVEHQHRLGHRLVRAELLGAGRACSAS